MRLFRLFLSSPGDAAVERRRTESIVSRLNGEFAGLARLETVRWETEFYRADATFQSQIPQSAECDIVVGILRWRLGTELPPDFSRLPDGGAYPSGTAYELLSAIDKRKGGGELPDVFVFRYAGGAPNPRLDDPARAAIERDWAALRGFFARWFLSEDGHFLAAMNNYGSEDDFEQQLETLLRKWLAEKVAAGRVVQWPTIKGSPFRGLSVFGARHAPVFFGRAGDIRRATDLWRDQAAKSTPFLLLVGASGAGKSSLARAGLIPRLTTAGVVPAVDLWRVAVMRPGDSRNGPFMTLAGALLQGEADLPTDEEGRGPALPEIAEGDCKTPADLASVLGHADRSAIRVIVNALARVGERARDQDRYGRAVRCDLVLLVDQLDELFAASLAAEVRAKFADLLQALVGSGRVWLIATLRADLYAPMLDLPGLKALKDAGASYDLAPPGPVDLAEIVRAPAAAAALTFDTDPATGERLDETLLREADRPDMLPLLQLALSRLWEARETRGEETVLPVAAFRALGGLRGIVEDAAETALRGLGEVERARLPTLIRRLAEIARERGGATAPLTARAVPLVEAASDPAARALVDALVAARLLTLSGEGRAASVRLAHQRVLSDWARAATIVAESADFYRVRDEVEDQRRRWDAGRRRGELLLSRGLPLAEAREMAGRYGAELRPETLAYVAASRRRANRALVLASSAAVVFALLAIGAAVIGKVALDEKAVAERQTREAETQRAAAEVQRQAAETNFGIARTAVDGLIFDIAQGLRGVGLPIEVTRRILETARGAVDRLEAAEPNDRNVQISRAAMFHQFSDTYADAGDLKGATEAAQQSLDIERKLVARYPGDDEVRRNLAVGIDVMGRLKARAGDGRGALAAYEEGLGISRDLVARYPKITLGQRDQSSILGDIADVKQAAGDVAGALAAFEEALGIDRRLAALVPADAEAQRDVSLSLYKIGEAKVALGDQAGALASAREGLEIRRRLATQDPGSAEAQRDLSISLNQIGDMELRGGDLGGASDAYRETLDIRRVLVARDPRSARDQRFLAVALERIGNVRSRAGDRTGALAAYEESLGISRTLAVQDPSYPQAQLDLTIGLSRIGDMKLHGGDGANALVAYQEMLPILRKLVAGDQPDVLAVGELRTTLQRIGDVKLQNGDRAAAMAAYRESLDIGRRLAAEKPDDAEAQRDLSRALSRLGDVKSQSGERPEALAALRESIEIERRLAASHPPDLSEQRDLSRDLIRIADVERQDGDGEDASRDLGESLEIQQRLAEQDPGQLDDLNDRAAIWDRLARIAQAKGDRVGALAASRERLALDREIAAKKPGDVQARSDLAGALGSAAAAAVFAREYADALALADEAVALRPDLVWLYADRAHALMMLGRTDEARVLYLKYRGQTYEGDRHWEQTVTADFAALRKIGITSPLMDEIATDFDATRSAAPSR